MVGPELERLAGWHAVANGLALLQRLVAVQDNVMTWNATRTHMLVTVGNCMLFQRTTRGRTAVRTGEAVRANADAVRQRTVAAAGAGGVAVVGVSACA